MPRFTGKQYPGALKDLREQRKLEAQQRNSTYQALSSTDAHGSLLPPERDGWVQINDTAHERRGRGAATRLLNAIFGSPLDREAQP